MIRLAREKLSVANIADELSVPRRHLAAHRHGVRPALDIETFKRIVIQIHLVRLGGDFTAVARIGDDQIGRRSRVGSSSPAGGRSSAG